MTSRGIAFASLFISIVCYSPVVKAQKVLLVADDDAAGTMTLKGALEGAGMTVTQTAVPSWQYDGTNPAPAGFDVIVLLAGTTNARANDMPAGGQNAIVQFVSAGGGLVETEWAAFQVDAGRWRTLKPLVLLTRTSGTIGLIDYKVDPAFMGHPLWDKLPASFTVSMATNVGGVIPGPGVVRLATSVAAGDAVVFRDLVNAGRIAELSSAGNYTNALWANANMRQLLVNAAKWASKSRSNRAPSADPGGPYAVDEGGTLKLKGACADPDADATTESWDLDGNGAFVDATGPEPLFDATMLDGPQVIQIGLRCTDTGNLSADKTVMLTVRNVAPKITSMPPSQAVEGALYDYPATVLEPFAGDDPQCSLVAGPMGMTVAGRSCRVQWLPSYDQARKGMHAVTVSVRDKDGDSTTQSWTINAVVIDSDNDRLPDTWERLFFPDLAQTAGGDPDGDGRPNLKELQDGTDPTKYDGPNAPVIVSPDGDIHTVRKPALTVKNAASPLGDALVYTFEIYSDAQLLDLVDVNLTVLEGGNGETAWAPQTLPENQHFFFRVRARDAFVAGPWSGVGRFFTDELAEPPTAPRILMPLNQSKIKTIAPRLEVQNAKSPDEWALTYTFEVWSDEKLMAQIEAKDLVAEGKMGITRYDVAAQLAPYTRFYWRARATDEKGLSGPWSELVWFMITPVNPPPSPPEIRSPKEGARVGTLTPEIVVGGSSDPDEEEFVYLCELDISVEFASGKLQKSEAMPPGPMNEAKWTPATLTENQRACVRCRAQTMTGTSGWSQLCFRVDTKNDPPSVPVLMNPSDGGMTAGDVVRFTWANSIDPEGDPIRYDIEVFVDEALSKRVLRGEGDDGPTGTTLIGVPPGDVWWRARAVDVFGAASDWSKANRFTAGGGGIGGDMRMNGDGCGCRLGAADNRKAERAWILLMALGALLRRKRRNPRRD